MIIRERIESRQRRIVHRLDKFNYPEDLSKPMMRGPSPQFELSGRTIGTAYGGIGLIHQFVKELGLAEAIDQRVHLFKIHLPYHESDHVLSLAYNALCEGRCLEDLELRRQDEAYLNLLGAARIPDPTTAGDFCRRFQPEHLTSLQEAFDVIRLQVWARQPASFFDCAVIEADGTMVETAAECKQGIDISYKGVWGYHPLVVTLANTGEVLRLKNRSGNRPSHEGRGRRTTGSVDRIVPQGGLSQNRPSRRHRLLADEISRRLARARRRDVRVRLRLHQRTGAPGRRSAGNRLETAVSTAAIRGEDVTSAQSPNPSNSRSLRNAASRTFACSTSGWQRSHIDLQPAVKPTV